MSFPSTELRMSASMTSVCSSWTDGLRVSSPATYSISGARSSRRASVPPTWLPTPVISTRRPAIRTSAWSPRPRPPPWPPPAGAPRAARACGRWRGARCEWPVRPPGWPAVRRGRPWRCGLRPPCAGRPPCPPAHPPPRERASARGRPIPRWPARCARRRLGRRRAALLVWSVAWPCARKQCPIAASLSCAAVSLQHEVRPIHLRPAAALAERVLLPGDRRRALSVAQDLLDKPLMFNHSRGLWGYSGVAADEELLTIQSTGIGGPSAAIVVEELIALGARRLVRIGTCGALDGRLEAGALVAAEPVLPTDGASSALGAGAPLEPDPTLTRALVDGGAAPVTVVSSDLFYDPREEAARDWMDRG